MSSHIIIGILGLLLHQIIFVAPAGYHYDHPAAGGHFFTAVSTVSPLPPVPALPPLPTARTNTGNAVHPSLSTHPIADPYRTTVHTGTTTLKQYDRRIPLHHSAPIRPPVDTSNYYAYRGPAFTDQSGSNLGHSLALYPYAVPTPGTPTYQFNNDMAKQYEVVELIDNDIEVSREPFLMKPFFDHIRQRVDIFGTGSLPSAPAGFSQALPSGGQQRQAQQPPTGADSITLGSGGLGFVRLPNGNIFLGSGSLGYISSQQRSQVLQDIRTRPGDVSPDAIHFGHGAFVPITNFLRQK